MLCSCVFARFMNELVGQSLAEFPVSLVRVCVDGWNFLWKDVCFPCSHSWAVRQSGKTPSAIGNTNRKLKSLTWCDEVWRSCSEEILHEEEIKIPQFSFQDPACFPCVAGTPGDTWQRQTAFSKAHDIHWCTDAFQECKDTQDEGWRWLKCFSSQNSSVWSNKASRHSISRN